MNKLKVSGAVGLLLIGGTIIALGANYESVKDVVVDTFDRGVTMFQAVSVRQRTEEYIEDITTKQETKTEDTDLQAPTQIAHTADELYTHVTFSEAGSATSYTVDGVALYNQIPWDDDGNWYKLDYYKCATYIKAVMNNDLKHGAITSDSASKNHGTITHDNVACHRMSMSPTMAWLGCDETGEVVGWSSSVADAHYGVACFSKNGQYYYWPITGGDNMGHSWPGGVAQTMLPNNGKYDSDTGMVTFSNWWDCTWNGATPSELTVDYRNDILSGDVYSKHLGYSRWSPPAYATKMPEYHLEMLGSCATFFKNNGFNFEYFIMHKD